MNSKLYRCGWCGHPTDDKGTTLKDEQFKRVVNLLDHPNVVGHIHLVNGDCCPNGNEPEERPMVQVTRDMAKDAGDMRLEGQWIRW